MIKITYNESIGDTYAYEYLKGNFEVITFMKYKRHNIAIPNVILCSGEIVVIDGLSSRRYFWNRDGGCRVTTKYVALKESELLGQGFELYDVVKGGDN